MILSSNKGYHGRYNDKLFLHVIVYDGIDTGGSYKYVAEVGYCV